MKVDDALILKLEQLAQLELTNDERKLLKGDLEDIIKMIDKLNELDTTDVAPLMHLTDNHTIVREDEVNGEIDMERALANAPVSKAPYFKVPKVINRDT